MKVLFTSPDYVLGVSGVLGVLGVSGVSGVLGVCLQVVGLQFRAAVDSSKLPLNVSQLV